MITSYSQPLSTSFKLSQTVITPTARDLLDPVDVYRAIQRHASGDWGELSPDDKAENELSVKEGFRILSAYRDRNGTKFWIITEGDRSVTTILLPEDY
jgi:hypothetical protein